MRKEELDLILNQILDSHKNVSDINITVGKPFQVESSGALVQVDLTPTILALTPYQTELIAMLLLQGSLSLIRTLISTGSCDCSYQLSDRARFRVNIFSQRGAYSIVLRKLATHIPSIKDMGLPDSFYQMAKEKNGLVLVTGPTGSGKSTSLASVLRYINETFPIHVVTLEDPIEFEHKHQLATFNQRELGLDFDTFASGLKAALRQAPKVILVGEMRDRETVEIGLTAAETGHLVLSTLHTINAGQTINRIVGLFEKEEQDMVRMRLAETIKWIACQRLLPKIGGGRVAAIEILASTMRSREIIASGESEKKQFYDVLNDGKPYGMRSFDQHILDLYENDWIDDQTALSYCTRKSVIGQGIDKIKARRGESTSSLPDLEMQRNLDEELKKGKIDSFQYQKLKQEEAVALAQQEVVQEEPLASLQMESMVLNNPNIPTVPTVPKTASTMSSSTLAASLRPSNTSSITAVGQKPTFPKPGQPSIPPKPKEEAPPTAPPKQTPSGKSTIWEELSDLQIEDD